MVWVLHSLGVILLLFVCLRGFAGESLDPARVPGVIINHIAAVSECYVGSPSIAILPNGDYIATHDEFGPKSGAEDLAVTHVFRSSDHGETWKETARIDGAFWASVFVHRGALYLLGTIRQSGDMIIRRSDDGGLTWTTPKDEHTGLLAKGKYHCAPVPVVEHNGRLWRCFEDLGAKGTWPTYFQALITSVPVDADLLEAKNWRFSNRLARNQEWLNGKFSGWLEGNAVVAPSGELLDILRVDSPLPDEKAAIVQVSPDGETVSFDPTKGFVDFPGGAKKFTIRWDAESKRYWSLANFVPKTEVGPEPSRVRNTLSLISSRDLRHWKVGPTLLHHSDSLTHGFQYVDWLFEGKDLIAVCRTAYDDGLGGAHNFHDANYLTFHRVKEFRKAR